MIWNFLRFLFRREKKIKTGWKIYAPPRICIMNPDAIARVLVLESPEQQSEQKTTSIPSEEYEELLHPGLKHFLERMEI